MRYPCRVRRWLLCACAALAGGAVFYLLASQTSPSPSDVERRGGSASRQALATATSIASPEHRVSGRVLSDGSPFQGATVRYAPVGAVARSGVEGRFDLGVPPFYAREVVASAPGRRAATVTIPSGEARQNVHLVLEPCAAVLSGTVYDVAGGRIPYPSVRSYRQGATIAESTGDGVGAYSVCAEPGPTWLEIGATGYASTLEQVFATADGRRDVVLQPEAVIEGRIVDADSGEPVEGAVAATATSGRPLGLAQSDDQGRFRIAGIAPGQHTLSCYATGRRPVTHELVRAGVAETEQVECRVRSGRKISGTVVSEGRLVPGLPVHVSSAAGDIGTRTDEQGAFSIDALPDGKLSLIVEDAVLYDQQPPAIPTSGDVVGIALRIGPRPAISGRVTRAGRAVAGVSVEARASSSGFPRRQMTDPSGRYSFRDVPPTNISLFAFNDAMTIYGHLDLKLSGGEQRSDVDIELADAGSISGRCVDEEGLPVGGVLVRFNQQLLGGHDVTSATGQFTVRMLAADKTYSPAVYSLGSMVALDAAPGSPFPNVRLTGAQLHVDGVRLVLRRDTSTISGHVLNEEGLPVSDVTVELLKTNRAPIQVGASGSMRAVSDMNGMFTILNVPTGDYSCVVTSPSGVTTVMVSVSAPAAPITVALPNEGQIEGTISGFTGRVNVVATNDLGRQYIGVANGDHFSIHNVATGHVSVVAWERDQLNPRVAAETVVVEPSTVTHSSLTARPVYRISVTMPFASGDVANAYCHVRIHSVVVTESANGPVRQIALDVPAGLDGLVVCWAGSRTVWEHALPSTTRAGGIVEFEVEE